MRLLSRFLIAMLILTAAPAAFPFFFIDSPVQVVEFVNDANGRHVLLTDPNEIAMVESGGVGPWRRTGYAFGAIGNSSSAGLVGAPVCRFYAPPPGAHFYTVDPAECEALKRPGSGWNFEGIPFRALAGCSSFGVPVYHLYNGRPYEDADHRFTPDPALHDALVAQGWIDEGLAFCANNWGILPAKSFVVMPTAALTRPECLSNVGACFALDELAPMPNVITPFLPPLYTQPNPLWRDSFTSFTGLSLELHTAQPVDDPAAVAAHSFVQFSPLSRSASLAMRLSPADRRAWPWKSASPMYRFATTPASGSAKDERVFPWGDAREHYLDVSFFLQNIGMIRRHTPDSHAYGLPVVRFRDVTSGASFQLAIETFGTLPPGEGVGRDAKTGDVIVVTAFQDGTRFGKRISGRFVPCEADDTRGSCTRENFDPFRFRIERDDFERIVAAARAADPRLSPNLADYMLAEYEFRAETYLEGELGVWIDVLKLELFGS